MAERILVHTCCAPDALYVWQLLNKTYEVTGFFYNPNIHPETEYLRRLEETRRVSKITDVPLVIDEYKQEDWFKATEKYKNQPEKGWRCNICYAIRIDRTAKVACRSGFDAFTTVLTVSPWKKAAVINKIGQMLGRRYGIKFIESDFKKKNGFKKSVELSHSHSLYRQNYCGCIYSRQAAILNTESQR